MQRYNVVYSPLDPDMATQCVRYAQNFARNPAGYLLNGVDALPHVTICQFYAGADELSALWGRVGSVLPPSITLSFEQLCIWDDGSGYLWICFGVKRDPTFVDLQTKVVEIVTGSGKTVATGSGDDYFPHLTLANVATDEAKATPAFGQIQWLDNFYGRSFPFSLGLGLCNQYGVLNHEIFRAPRSKDHS